MSRALAEPPGDVIFRQLVTWVGKNLVCLAYLDNLAEVKIGGTLRNPRGLLHRVRHNGDSEVLT